MTDTTQVSSSGAQFTINPVRNFLITSTGVHYTFSMPAGSVLDTSNNSFVGISGTLFKFRTKPDLSRPDAIAFSPVSGSTDVPTTPNIVLIFNEPIQRGTGNMVLTP